MDPDTKRDDPGFGGDVYWRRRMSVLVAVLVVVAVVAWACSSSGSGPQRAADTRPSPSATPVTDPLLAGLRTLAQGTVSPTQTPTPSATTKTTAKATPQTRPRRPGETCPESELVIGLQGRQEIYAGGTRPNFLVTVVNTGPVMCKADVGPRAMEIRITSGEDRIWSTSDCVSGSGAEIKELKRGVPYVRSLDWNRHRSSGNCRGTPPKALPGTYVAVARMGKLRSPKGVFHLR